MSGATMRMAGLAVAVGLVLSACAGGAPDPDVTASFAGGSSRPPVASPSPPMPSPVPAPPERPKAMLREDATGAAAAAEYFIELYPYVMATGDTAEFEAMSHPECGFCAQALADANRIQDHNQHFQGGETEAKLLDQFLQDALTGIYPLDFEVMQQESSTVDSDNSVRSAAEAQVSEHRVEISWKSDRWIVVAIAPRPEL